MIVSESDNHKAREMATKTYYENSTYVADEADIEHAGSQPHLPPTAKSDQIHISLPLPLPAKNINGSNGSLVDGSEPSTSSSSQNEKSSRENILDDFVRKSKLQVHKCRPWLKYVLFLLYNVYFVFAIVKSYDEVSNLLMTLSRLIDFTILHANE